MKDEKLSNLIAQVEGHLQGWSMFSLYLTVARTKNFSPEEENQFAKIRDQLLQEQKGVIAGVKYSNAGKEDIEALLDEWSLLNEASSMRYLSGLDAHALDDLADLSHNIYIGWQSTLGRLKQQQSFVSDGEKYPTEDIQKQVIADSMATGADKKSDHKAETKADELKQETTIPVEASLPGWGKGPAGERTRVRGKTQSRKGSKHQPEHVREFSIEEYAKEFAASNAKLHNITEDRARENLNEFMTSFVHEALKKDKEVEFPFGSGLFYRRTGRDRFVLSCRSTPAQIKRMKQIAGNFW